MNCHHLIVVDRKNDEVIGTYHRMQTDDRAAAVNEFYSAGEFDLTRLPEAVVKKFRSYSGFIWNMAPRLVARRQVTAILKPLIIW